MSNLFNELYITKYWQFISSKVLLKFLPMIIDNKLLFAAVFIPVAISIIYIFVNFVFDFTHIFDDYNAKNSFTYKGINRYEKNQKEQRRNEEKQKKLNYQKISQKINFVIIKLWKKVIFLLNQIQSVHIATSLMLNMKMNNL